MDQIENRIKKIFENNPGFAGAQDLHANLIHQFCISLQQFLSENENISQKSLITFEVYLNPEDLDFLKKQPAWQDNLSEIFFATFLEFGYKLINCCGFIFNSKNSLNSGELFINTIENKSGSGKTGAIPLKPEAVNSSEMFAQKNHTKLLIDGKLEVALSKTVTNIGRHSSNDLVIDDLRISRKHAQIRKSQSRFRIFDIDSTGGTFVNSERISSHILRTGDVISLAGYTLIFIDEMLEHVESKRESTAQILTNKPVHK